MRSVDLFREYAGKGLLKETLGRTAELLEENQFGTGEEAWQEAFSQKKEMWGLTPEEWDIVYHLGRAFFGNNRSELGRLLDGGRKQLEECLETEKHRFQENQKVVMPVGMLGAMLLILILV